MKDNKLSGKQAYWLGQVIVNGGVVLIMVGVWVLSFVVVAAAHLSVWIILLGIFAGPLVAWIWWSFSVPRWRYWVRQYLNEEEIEALHQQAVSGQMEWSRGHIFEKTEFKSILHKNQDLNLTICSIEKYLHREAPELIEEFKVSFPDFDTGVIDEITNHTLNLRARISSNEDSIDYAVGVADVDRLIEKLQQATDLLKGRQWGEVREWLLVVSELTIDSTD